MPYGEIRVDTITFTNGGADTSITVSGLAASTTGNLTVTGTVSGTTATFVTGVFTSSISGAVITAQSGIIASGTAANPSLSFIGDANTGLYSPGADQVAISTSGTGRLFVTSAGTVGVNVSSPAASFHISAAVPRVRVSVSGNSNQYSDFFNSNGSTFIDSRNDTLNGPIVFRGAASGVTDEYSRFDAVGRFLHGYSSSVDTRNYLNNTYGGPYYQRHGLTQAETVTALYNWSTSNAAGASIVLNKSLSGTIGTRGALTTNGTDLGAITFTGDDGTTFVPAAAILAELDGTPGTNDMPGRLAFLTTADGASAPTERMRITQAGDVGIGTNNPGARLHISNGTDTSVGEFTALTIGGTNITSARTGSIIKDTTTYDLIYKNQNFSSSTGSHVFRNGPEEHLRIDSNGRLLIGTSTALNLSGIAGFEGIQLAGTTGFSSASLSRFSVDETGSFITFAKSRGASVGTNAVVTTGDDIGTINFTAADGTGYISAARIRVEVDGTPGTNDMPGRLTFSTTADGASSPTERMRIDSSGRLLVGTSSARGGFGGDATVFPGIQLEGTGAYNDPRRFMSLVHNSANSFAPFLYLGKTRGTSNGAVTAVQVNDELGSIAFMGADGTDLKSAALIQSFVDGTPGSNDMPGRLVFSITADGASSPTERMRIDSAGRVGIGTATGAGKLSVATSSADPGAGVSAWSDGYTLVSPGGTSTSGGIALSFDTTGNTGSLSCATPGTAWRSINYRGNEHIFYRNGATENARFDGSGRLLVGTSSSRSNVFGQAVHQIEGSSSNAFSSITVAENNPFGGALVLAKTRGSSFQAVANGDNLGILSWQGANGSALIEGARIQADVDGVVSGGGVGDLPTRLVFSTTADGASSPTERMRIDSSGRLLVGTTTADTSGNALLQVNGSIKGTVTSETSKATTSGTAVEFTGIPSWVKKITLMLNGISLSGNGQFLIQLGSGSFKTSDYVSTGNFLSGGVTSGGASSTAGFLLYNNFSANIQSGHIVFTLQTGNTWIGSGVTTFHNSVTNGFTAGNVTLSGALDRIRLTSTDTATNNLDAGSINILYEG